MLANVITRRAAVASSRSYVSVVIDDRVHSFPDRKRAGSNGESGITLKRGRCVRDLCSSRGHEALIEGKTFYNLSLLTSAATINRIFQRRSNVFFK